MSQLSSRVVCAALLRDVMIERGVFEQQPDPVREPRRVIRRDQEPGFAIGDDLGDPRRRRGQDGDLGRLGFEDRQETPLAR